VEPEEKVNVLLVDDQAEGLLALEAMLEPLGQNLVRARSGREVLRQLLSEEFAVILLDVQMPEMDGFATAEMIRRRERTRHTPIIFLTALQKADQHVFRGYAVGAVDYLSKPIEPEILRSKVLVFVELTKKAQLVRRQTQQLIDREHEARRLLAEIEQKNRDLEAVNKELEAFSYSVSHDLRAPLRSIDGFSLALLEDYSEKLDAEGRDCLRRVRSATQRMGMLIDDLLNLSRVSRTEMRLEKVDLSAIGRSIAAELQKTQPERQTEFRIEDGLEAIGDSHLIRIVLENLFGNSWKFTSKRDSACIEFAKTDRNGTPTYFVRDDGAGFEPAQAERLFGAFQRLHDNKDFPGTGIGLATVQRIIHRHGGRIWAEGAVDRGATFYFTLLETKHEGSEPWTTKPFSSWKIIPTTRS